MNSTATIAEPTQTNGVRPSTGLSWKALLLWAAGAIASFHAAYSFPSLSVLILFYPLCLVQLTRTQTTRKSFYVGLAVGLLTAGPQLSCFWVIFGLGAVALWLVLAIWIALFAAISRICVVRYGPVWGALLISFIWTGLEYFRSELYYLRFSWLNVGYAFSHSAVLPAYKWLGIYGVGFCAMSLAVVISHAVSRMSTGRAVRLSSAAAILLIFCAPSSPNTQTPGEQTRVKVAGVQMEFPNPSDVVPALDKLLAAEPGTELFVLSEYTLDGPVPEPLRNWCRLHERYLIVGGKDEAPNSNFYDTAFVVGPKGDIVFRQVKSVPIQFFKDGLPAPEQKLWESPWGRIGICVCYDLSYTRVTDRLIRLGAQALIVPTMDVVDWGRRQHELHARVAPIRAAEYGVPIFRVASSGISQLVDHSGGILATASFPGEAESITGTLTLSRPGSLPLDRWLAPLASGVTALAIVGFFIPRRAKNLVDAKDRV